MNPNQLRNQFVSTLNPDSLFNIPFKHDIQKNPHIRYEEKKEGQSLKMKSQAITQDKKRFLSLVSKHKKGLKRSKSNKKMLQKRSQSVILGGTKKTLKNTTKTESSLLDSLCKSCTNMQQSNQNTSSKVPNNGEIRNDNFFSQRNIPMNLITQPHQNNTQLTKIISHKLKLDAVPPHEFITQKIKKTNEDKGGFVVDRERLLRNMSTGSRDRAFFSVGGEKKQSSSQKQVELLKAERTLLTPSFEKQQINNQRKRRQGAGFIRSASARKSSPLNENNQNKRITQFSFVQKVDSTTSNQPFRKGQDIDKCIMKMSLIRKEINELQSMIHERLQQSQVRAKKMHNSQTLKVKDMNEMSESRVVNELNEMSRSLCMSSKSALGESINRLNVIQNSNSGQFRVPQKQPLSSSTNPNVMNLGETYKLIKYPESISQQLLEKQFVGTNPNGNVKSQFSNNMRNNQQNHFTTNRLPFHQNHHCANGIR